MNVRRVIVAGIGLVFVMQCTSAFAMVEIIEGSDPIRDPGLPIGAIELGNHKARIGGLVGPPFGTGSQYTFQYQGNTKDFNEALKLFADVRGSKRELVVHNGPNYDWVGRRRYDEPPDPNHRVDWQFDVWVAGAWERLYAGDGGLFHADYGRYNRPAPPPRIGLYLGGGGEVEWDRVKVPENVVVIDNRPGSIAPQFAGKGLVRATVVDMETGKPIPKAKVVLTKRVAKGEPAEGLDAVTNRDGYCQIAGVGPGYFEVRVEAEGYAARGHDTYDNRRPEFLQFKIGLARSATITGTVVDSAGNPVAGVLVRARSAIGPDDQGYRPADETSATTDEKGVFVIGSLPKGLVCLSSRKKGLHQKTSINVQYAVPSTDVRLVMTGTGSVRIKVVDPDGNVPAEEVHVHVRAVDEQKNTWGGSARCAADGTFEFSGVPPGDYFVATDAMLLIEGDTTKAKRISVVVGQAVEVEVIHARRGR